MAGRSRTSATEASTQAIDVPSDGLLPAADEDGDGLPNGWEQRFGLDPESAAFPNGADADPDQDGLTNAHRDVTVAAMRISFVHDQSGALAQGRAPHAAAQAVMSATRTYGFVVRCRDLVFSQFGLRPTCSEFAKVPH